MKKTALVAACLMVVGPALSVVDAAPGGRPNARTVEAKVLPPDAPELFGTVTYDTGVNAGFHPDATAGNLNRTAGNRFNTALGGPLLVPGMVTMLTVFPANSGAQSITVAAPPTPANTAMNIIFVGANFMANVFNQVNIVPAAVVQGDFIGVFLGAYAATQPAGLVGMSDMDVNGQGFHAIQAFYVPGPAMQTMIETVPGRNAMLRATGDILVPVELMDFKIQ